VKRPLGSATRGTTYPNRLRRVDNWLAWRYTGLLRGVADPLVVDLGFGAHPVTTLELRTRLAAVPNLRVIGLEIDPVRVAAALPFAEPPWLDFALGGFELAGLRPHLVRAMNVLRQYDAADVGPAWSAMTGALAPGGVLVEGTCDELGRLACWITLDEAGPRTLTLAANLSTLDSPATLAERLPKVLIHRNVPGERVHDLLAALDEAWQRSAAYAVYGPRQRWRRSVAGVRAAGWPVADPPSRWRFGELTLPWHAVS